jgi:hypothetical protein
MNSLALIIVAKLLLVRRNLGQSFGADLDLSKKFLCSQLEVGSESTGRKMLLAQLIANNLLVLKPFCFAFELDNR